LILLGETGLGTFFTLLLRFYLLLQEIEPNQVLVEIMSWKRGQPPLF